MNTLDKLVATEVFERGLQNNDQNLVRSGIEGGADIAMPLGENGELTPLIYSANKGYDEICRLLLDAGADPNQRGVTGYIALCEAIINPKVSSERRMKTLALLLKHGAHVNVTFVSKIETTPLIHAAMKGYSDVCRLLLEANADPNQRNGRGHLALTEMIGNPKLTVEKRIEIATLLLNHGANPKLLDWGRPALHYAIEDERLISLLLQNGADVNQPSEYHELSAPRKGQNFEYQENALRLYLKHLVPSPVPIEHVVIKVLLDAGADPLLPNSEGYTAWDFVNNFVMKGPSNSHVPGLLGWIVRKRRERYVQARINSFRAYTELLRPIVMTAKYDLFVSHAKSSGWGEFYRGRLEQTGKRIWSSDLLKRDLPYYDEVMETHISNAPAAAVFLSPKHFGENHGSTERKRELDALVKRFSSMPAKLLFVTVGEESIDMLTKHPELNPFPSFHLKTDIVNELWGNLATLCGLTGDQENDAFQDIRQISSPSYDCFISYRTVSVYTVRFLAEQLVARGVKLWFAEWEILVSGRRGFQEAINRGIASSGNVICCTNSGYAQSEYCRIEAMQVLDVPGKESRHILDLRLPDEPNAVSEALQRHGSEAVYHEEQTLQNTWDRCCQFLRLDNSNLPKREEGGDRNRFELAGRDFYLATDSRWEIKRVNKLISRNNTVIAFYSRKVEAVTLYGELVVSPNAVLHFSGNQRDDFESAIKAIPEWNRAVGKILYPRGVHVVHLPALHSVLQAVAHPAFTYLDPDRNDYSDARDVPIEKSVWHRKYIIRVTPPHMPTDMEFYFDFDMRGVAHDDFATFCRYAYMMDDLVRGLSFNDAK